jgi:hypothetical protein
MQPANQDPSRQPRLRPRLEVRHLQIDQPPARPLIGFRRQRVVLDWDRRSPLPDGVRIHNPGADHELWGGSGTGDAETLAALIEQSALLVGVDSGPLHVAGATATPTLALLVSRFSD